MIEVPGIDPEGLVRLNKMGGPDFVKQMIDLFLEEAPDRLRAARTGESAGDFKAVSEAAHSLKSSSHNFGATQLALLAEKIEILTRSDSCENLSGMLTQLESTYSTVKGWLESQRDSLQK